MQSSRMNSRMIWVLLGLILISMLHKGATKGVFSKEIHHYMTKAEVQKYFGVVNHKQVPEYDVTSPYVSNAAGEFVQFYLHQSRHRRTTDEPDVLYYKLKAFGSDLHLKMMRNNLLMAPNFSIVKRNKGGFETSIPVPKKSYFFGRIISDPQSTVALSNLRGLTGMIKTSRDTLFVRPLPAHLAKHVINSAAKEPHLVYRSSSGGGALSPRFRRSSPDVSGRPNYLEVALVVPLRSQFKYGHDNNIQRLLVMANIVAGMFEDASVGPAKIHFVVNKIYVVHPEELNITFNQSNHAKLTKMIRWAAKENRERNLFDAFVYITQGPDKGGKSTTNTLCKKHAGMVVTDEGLSTAWYIAHGIGHNMGLPYDNQTNDCEGGKYVMSAVKVNTPSIYSWSPCSRDKIQEFLASMNNSWCLKNTPPFDGPTLEPEFSGKLPGEIINGDKQCRNRFGKKFKHTDQKELKANCSLLWCQDKHGTVISDGNAAADGTKCGYRKWCINHSCVINPQSLDDEWGTCSRSCGGGVQRRQKECATPLTQRLADDECYEWRICSVQPCPKGDPSQRDIQCRERHNKSRGIFSLSDPCGLYCGPYGRAWRRFQHVDDGTRCNKFTFDVCIQGHCKAVGCDHVLGSEATYDRCRVCNGNGSTCVRMSGNFTEQLGVGKFGPRYARLILDLPVGTLSATFEEMDNTANIIAVQNAEGYFLSLRRARKTPQGKVLYAAGAKIVLYKKKPSSVDVLRILGPTTALIKVVLIRNGKKKTKGVRYEYYVKPPQGGTADQDSSFEWKTTDWSACSASCSSGIQTRKVRCVRTDDRTPANEKACWRKTKPTKNRVCHAQPCEPSNT